jgi:heat-inducible transcriptional repressor
MADLEENGLITHPHTSAGRIPTDLGYRYYVDLMMERKRLNRDEEAQIQQLAQLNESDPMALLEQATQLLSDLTQEAGVALIPQLGHGSFRHLELIQVGRRELVGVLISSEGLVRHARLELLQELDGETVDALADYLNEELTGMSLAQAHAELERIFTEVRERELAAAWQQALNLSRLKALFFENEASVILEGTSWILEAPEFQDIERTRKLLRGLENRSELAGILQKDLAADEVKLHIGSENRGTSLTDCTIAGASYRLGSGVMGTIGVVGPTRMDYPRVTAIVGRVAQAVSQAFQDR